MIRLAFLLTLLGLGISAPTAQATDDWPVWRGPNRNGIASANQTPPTKWDENTNIVWKSEVPGRGHSSPIIVGNRIFLSTAEDESQIQSVLCYDRESGRKLWQTPINESGFEKRIHGNNTHASSTIVTHNNRLFVVFNNNRSVQLAALDFEGKLLWEKTTGPFIPKYPFGFGSSPCIYKNLVIVMSDYPREGFLAAYEQSTGKEVWRTKRGQTSSYASPIVASIAGTDQLLVSGTDVRSYDPATGEELWDVPIPAWDVTCATVVWLDDTIFASGGFPGPGTFAVSATDHSILWQNQIKAYEQSLLAHDGYLYCHSDRGIAFCWRASDGKEMWKERVSNDGVSVSPILVGDLIYMTDESGQTAIIRANPEKFERIAENQLGGSAFATPAFVDNRIYTRVGTSKAESPQHLYCIGEK